MGKSTVYVCFSILLMFNIYSSCHSSSLYPRPSETRQIQELNGMWNFRADFSPNSDRGFTEKWFRFPLSKVSVAVWGVTCTLLNRWTKHILSVILMYPCCMERSLQILYNVCIILHPSLKICF